MDKQEAIQEAKREYMRRYMQEYRKKNKEKIKQHNENYWLKQAKLETRSLETLERELQELKERAFQAK